MNIDLAGYTFEGPFKMPDGNNSSLKDKSGVYVILGYKGGKSYYVDVGESEDVKKRVANHDREECWKKTKREQGYTELKVAAHYVGKTERMKIETKIRKEGKPSCGKE